MTNRDDVATADDSEPTQPPTSRTLSQQVVDAIYKTAPSTIGFADVRIPASHRRGQCSTDLTKPARVDVAPLIRSSNEDFYPQLQRFMEAGKTQEIFVFVHGFNVSLQAAVARAAQMAEDMPFHGVVVVFSWQSAASADAYLTDEKLAERHFWGLAELLVNLNRRCDHPRIHVLAHSMGNRVTLRALSALAGRIGPTGTAVDPFMAARLWRTVPGEASHSEQSRVGRSVLDGTEEVPVRFPDWGAWRSGNITQAPLASLVLAAPDVDAGEFRGLVEGIQHLCDNMVLYASDTDVPLEASRKLHGGAYRAGDSRAKLDIDGLRIVHVTGVDGLDPLGHSYYGSHPKILTQLSGLMRPPVVALRVSDWR